MFELLKSAFAILIILFVIYRIFLRNEIIVLKYKYIQKKINLELDKSYTEIELFDLLKSKGFDYPDLKNIRVNEKGIVIIEGKYSGYELIINENIIEIHPVDTYRHKCIEEAEVIKNYIKKTININAPIDPYIKYKKFKNNKYKTAIAFIILIVFVFYVIYDKRGEINSKVLTNSANLSSTSNIFNTFKSSNISEQYLTKYSEAVTIGEAFNNFFINPKWKPYEIGIQKYVDFQGVCQYNGEDATAVITFAVFDGYFSVNSVKIDGNDIGLLEIDGMLSAIFNEENKEETPSEEDLQSIDSIEPPTNQDVNIALEEQNIEYEHNGTEFLYSTISDLINEYGENYILPDDWWNGARYIYYENIPYVYLFSPKEWNSTDVFNEEIIAIKVFEGGIIDGTAKVGMTFNELSNELGIQIEPEFYPDSLDLGDIWIANVTLYGIYDVWLYAESEDGKTISADINTYKY